MDGGDGGKHNKWLLCVFCALIVVIAGLFVSVAIVMLKKDGGKEWGKCDGQTMVTEELLECIEEKYNEDLDGKVSVYNKAIARAMDAEDEIEVIVLIRRKVSALMEAGDCEAALASYETDSDGLSRDYLRVFYQDAAATGHECGDLVIEEKYLELKNMIEGGNEKIY